MPSGVYQHKPRSEETKKKISESEKGKIISKETRTKISLAHIGKQLTKEHKSSISSALKGKKCLEETKIKIGLANKGKIRTEEFKKQISEKQKGKHNSLNTEFKKGQIDEKSISWKGDKVGYCGLHVWVKKRLGKPDTCEYCGRSELTGRKIHWANKSGNYLRDLSDWIRLCPKCHSKYDREKMAESLLV